MAKTNLRQHIKRLLFTLPGAGLVFCIGAGAGAATVYVGSAAAWFPLASSAFGAAAGAAIAVLSAIYLSQRQTRERAIAYAKGVVAAVAHHHTMIDALEIGARDVEGIQIVISNPQGVHVPRFKRSLALLQKYEPFSPDLGVEALIDLRIMIEFNADLAADIDRFISKAYTYPELEVARGKLKGKIEQAQGTVIKALNSLATAVNGT